MAFTTNKSPLKEKLGTPEGEVEIVDVSNIPASERDEERMNENDPIIEEVKLSETEEYVVGIKKSPDKKSELRNRMRHQTGKPIKRFTKKAI